MADDENVGSGEGGATAETRWQVKVRTQAVAEARTPENKRYPYLLMCSKKT